MNQTISRIVNVYESAISRLYCRIRFQIIHQRFLEEIGQYLPRNGTILDIGCGFGMFSLYYALNYPAAAIQGIDLNPSRIGKATRAAEKLGAKNVSYSVGDASTLQLTQGFDGIYMLDIIHHIPESAVEPLLRQIYTQLSIGGRLIIKDVSDTPAYKRWFTYLLDKAMDVHCKVNYWPPEKLTALLRSIGFEVYTHSMVDILPYPHLMYVCRRLG